MGILHPRPGPHPVHTIHRVSAAAIGGFLVVFAGLGFTRGLDLLSTQANWVMGLSTNGLLAALSLAAGLALLASAARSGPTASTISIVLGALFLLSGLGNMVVLGTAMNILAFQVPNIVFSVLVGTLLLVLGSHGRISGGLPPGNPYRDAVTDSPAPPPESPAERARNHVVATELAEAERASALHYATPDQLRRLTVVHEHRTSAERRQAWERSARHTANGAGR